MATLPRLDESAEKEVVERFHREVISRRDVEACDRLLTEDFVHNGEARVREGQKAIEYFLARRVEFTSTAILRVSGGLIAEAWDELDSGAIAAQLGPAA